jgi:CRP-like cAMP-binding protein
MDYSGILSNLQKHISLTKEETVFFTSLLHQKELRKKELLLQEGHPCKTITYVHSGMLRAFYRDADSNESIVMFAIDDWWITDMYSFVSGNPAMLNIDALEACVIFQLDKKDMDQLYLQVPKFERFFRIMMQNAYIREQLRALQNLSMSAEERYTGFMKKYPQFAQRVPLKQIASYLGMTPEFLSVLRKKTMKG